MRIDVTVHQYNKFNIQRAIISRILIYLGDDFDNVIAGEPKTSLESCIQRAVSDLPVSTRQARRYFDHYLLFGEPPASTKLYYKRKSKGVKVWRDEFTPILQNIVDDEPGLYLDELVDRLEKVIGIRVHASTVWRKLQEEVGYTLQVVSEKAIERDEEERASFKEAMQALSSRPDMFVFIDETHKDRNAARRKRWWSKRGRTPIRREPFHYDSKIRYTMLAAADVNGFIQGACDIVRRGNSVAQEEADENIGTVDRDRFISWVETCLVPVLGDYTKLEARSIVVLDNAAIHHDDEVVALIENAGAIIVYMSPYSPDLNPIEYFFRSYKASLRRNDKCNWFTAHLRGLDAVKPEIARAYFKHCEVPGCDHFLTEKQLKRRPKMFPIINAHLTQENTVTFVTTVVAVHVAKKRRISSDPE